METFAAGDYNTLFRAEKKID